MKPATEKAIDALLDLDASVPADQRGAAVAILEGRVPDHWPSFLRHDLQRNLAATTPANTPVATEPKKYLNRKEAARYIGFCVRQIDSLKASGDLPFYRVAGRRIVFKVDDLDAWMEKRRVSVDEASRSLQ